MLRNKKKNGVTQKSICTNFYEKGLNSSQEMTEHHQNELQNKPKKLLAGSSSYGVSWIGDCSSNTKEKHVKNSSNREA